MLDYRVRTFLETCRTGSVTRAARELSISQPAASQHLRQLERRYGCALLAKSGRGMEPTQAGRVLYRALSVMEADEERLARDLEALAGDARPPLRLGCTRTIADHLAPNLLAAHLRRHPDERLLMRTGNTHELVDLIDRGEVDFALVEGPFDHATLDSEPLSREACVVVGPPLWGAGEGRPESIAALRPLRLVLREPGSGTREILERALAARDLSTDDFAGTIELASIPAIKACVAAEAGVTFLYRRAAADELARGELVDMTPPDFEVEHDFSAVWQRGSLYAGRFRSLLEEWRGLA